MHDVQPPPDLVLQRVHRLDARTLGTDGAPPRRRSTHRWPAWSGPRSAGELTACWSGAALGWLPMSGYQDDHHTATVTMQRRRGASHIARGRRLMTAPRGSHIAGAAGASGW